MATCYRWREIRAGNFRNKISFNTGEEGGSWREFSIRGRGEGSMIKEKEKKKEKKEREKKVAMNVLSSVIQSDYARVSGYL